MQLISLALLFLLVQTSSLAEDVVSLSPSEAAFAEEFENVLYGGRPAKPGEIDVSVNIGNCTGSLVSQNVLLSAGHCRSTGSTISFRFKGKVHTGRCHRHPEYSQGAWLNNDFALCKFSPNVDTDKFATLKPVLPKAGDIVTMQGYGRGSNGVLNIGEAVIVRVNNMEAVTRGKVYLGGGDSGGALFARVTDLKNGPFAIVGVNSRGSGNTSLFNLTGLERSQKWFRDWAKSQGVDICGVNKECGNIPAPPLPPEEKPPADCLALSFMSNILKEELASAEIIEARCKAGLLDTQGRLLINGRLAEEGEFPEVVRISIGNSGCTATIVGPRTIITAAHCGPNNSTARFKAASKTYSATCTRHPSYPRKDIDIMLCATKEDITGVKFATIKGAVQVGDKITIAGYGCINPGGGGGNDGLLRVGTATVTGFSAYDIISGKGSALCFGDSGGPSFKAMVDNFKEHHYLVGVNSKGNIQDTNYNTNLDMAHSKDFLSDFAKDKGVEICGVNKTCDKGDIAPPPEEEGEGEVTCRIESAIAEYIRVRSNAARAALDKCKG